MIQAPTIVIILASVFKTIAVHKTAPASSIVVIPGVQIRLVPQTICHKVPPLFPALLNVVAVKLHILARLARMCVPLLHYIIAVGLTAEELSIVVIPDAHLFLVLQIICQAALQTPLVIAPFTSRHQTVLV